MKVFFSTLFTILTNTHLIIAQAVGYDNNGAGVAMSANTPTTLDLSFSVPANNNRLLVACAVNIANSQPPALTFNGLPMIKAATRTTLGSGSRMTLYYLPLGSSATSTSSTISALGGAVRNLIAGSFYNVNQSTPVDGQDSISFYSNSASGFTQTLAIASRANDRVCDCIGAFAASNSITGYSNDNGQTLIGKNTNTVLAGMSTKGGGSSIPMSWTYTGDFTITTNELRGSHVGINIISVSSILPVELVFFKGKQLKEGNELRWQTASESNNKGFHIQRSEDGKKWQDVSFVESIGSSYDLNDYSWIDDKPLSDNNFYRLKQEDFDGSTSYSAVVQINGGKNVKLSVYPNPTRDVLFYQYSDLSAVKRVQLYDVTGRLLQESTNISGQFSTQGLSSGMYWFVVQTDSENLYQRVVKQ